MATKKQSKLDKLHAYVEGRPPGPVTAAEWERLREMLAPVSEGYLRGLLRDLSAPMEPLVGGVDQSSFETLEASLVALVEIYESGAGPACRKLVLQAKDHARWASVRAKDETRRREKREMTEWMRVWLANPGVFPAWARMRKQTTEFRSIRA